MYTLPPLSQTASDRAVHSIKIYLCVIANDVVVTYNYMQVYLVVQRFNSCMYITVMACVCIRKVVNC